MSNRKWILMGAFLGVWLACGSLMCGCGRADKEETVLEARELEVDPGGDEVSTVDGEAVEAEESKVGTGDVGEDTKENVGTEDETAKGRVFVYVCGAVGRPGVYEADEGSRIFEVLEMAGGVTDVAAEQYLNLAETVADGQKIVVPTQEEALLMELKPEGGGGSDSGGNSLVNLNTAGEEELTSLPGIGASKAKSIIAYREEHGGFQKVDEIKNIEGIKDGVFQKIKDLITVK